MKCTALGQVCFHARPQSGLRVCESLDDGPLVFIFIILLLLMIYPSLLFSYLNTLSAHSYFLFGDFLEI